MPNAKCQMLNAKCQKLPPRSRFLNDKPCGEGPVVYWMQRDQRVNDNWALVHAQHIALERKRPLVVIFCLVTEFLEATTRHFQFMLNGLQEVEEELKALNIQFVFLEGDPLVEIPTFVEKVDPSCIITDFNPLRLTMAWKRIIANTIKVSMIEVDAHNIVPCWVASPKLEFGARTIRGKIQKLLPDFLDNIPPLVKHPNLITEDSLRGWKIENREGTIKDRKWNLENGTRYGGRKQADLVLERFLNHRLKGYDQERNFPELDGQSGLSPFLHFGQISVQRVALEVSRFEEPSASKFAYLEELIIRRELSDNFCFYNENYDRFEGFPAWAQRTLNAHRNDPREYTYTFEQFESAETHDPLWNAAQMEMVNAGKMHGYMRMYWAKKILEWSASPEEAMAIAIYLNDKYEFDGRDPNGYAGVAWSIGGVHDRPWAERPIFGQIRYMNYHGCLRKFNVKAYITNVLASRS